ncbi:hypothetical protein BaRGS_00007152 [Batillaria attramentaria]|uniref:Uncharacterized protein n=1 Tax=Batillaria attramentaria TaxID=370345 RepID=A0ABD0LRC7_9CAEN
MCKQTWNRDEITSHLQSATNNRVSRRTKLLKLSDSLPSACARRMVKLTSHSARCVQTLPSVEGTTCSCKLPPRLRRCQCVGCVRTARALYISYSHHPVLHKSTVNKHTSLDILHKGTTAK